jgi:glycosyltransferase involved in cell wall biosynthesis
MTTCGCLGQEGKKGVTSINPHPFPRLLVLCEMPVEKTAGGALVLFRLLQTYPPERLLIYCRTTAGVVNPTRLPGVTYRPLDYRIPRVIWNRFNPFWPSAQARYITLRTSRLCREIEAFAPQAVLTLTTQFGFFLANTLAARFRIPLHLILHDDWPTERTQSQPKWARPLVRKVCARDLGRVWRRAATRFCVSPGMLEYWSSKYGGPGVVLYPSRGDEGIEPRVRVCPSRNREFVVAFAGSIPRQSTVRSLSGMADALAYAGGRLDLYVSATESRLAELGLLRPNVRRLGWYEPEEMARRVSETADALFLPTSFESAEQIDMATLFPSKLADYTAIGLPVLIWAPRYSSAARWVTENQGAAELITDPDPTALREPIIRLTNPEYAAKVASAGVAAGIRDFSATTVRKRFMDALVDQRGRRA